MRNRSQKILKALNAEQCGQGPKCVRMEISIYSIVSSVLIGYFSLILAWIYGSLLFRVVAG